MRRFLHIVTLVSLHCAHRGSPEVRTPSTLDLVSGTAHSCALREGQVSCWGSALYIAQEADGVVATLLDVSAIAAGSFHTCALQQAGRVWCWGDNNDGQLGQGDVGEPVLHPRPILLPNPAVAIAAGLRRSCARLVSGDVWCWGAVESFDPIRGNTTLWASATPTPLPPGRGCGGAMHVDGWCMNASSESPTLRVGGAGRCEGAPGALRCIGHDPALSRDLPGAVVASVGSVHMCAMDGRGDVTCWGDVPWPDPVRPATTRRRNGR